MNIDRTLQLSLAKIAIIGAFKRARFGIGMTVSEVDVLANELAKEAVVFAEEAWAGAVAKHKEEKENVLST